MRNLMLILLIGFSWPAMAQNAWYDARNIVRWNKADTKESSDSIVATLMHYADRPDTIENVRGLMREFGGYIKLARVLVDLNLNDLSLDEISRRLDSVELNMLPAGAVGQEINAAIKQIRILFSTVNSLSDSLNKLVAAESQLSRIQYDTNYNYREELLAVYNRLNDPDRLNPELADTANIRTRIVSLKSNIKDQIDETRRKILNLVNGNNSRLKQFFTSLPGIALTGQGYEPKQGVFNILTEQLATQSDQLKDNNEVSDGGGFSIPSQSDVIDALAIYLASRVKLETALTFIEYIKKGLKKDSVLLNLFPETINLFSSYSSYEMPNFGSVWQQAFAEDFAKIPERIAAFKDTGNYFFRQFADNPTFKFLHQSVEVAMLAYQQHSLTDIIQYLNNRYDTFSSARPIPLFGKFIRLFNMLNEEFYSTGADRYWISFSDFNHVSNDEMLVLAALLHKKYRTKVFDFLNVNVNTLKPATTRLTAGLQDMKEWLSGIFFLINQFQSAQQSVAELKKAGKVAIANQQFWKFMPDMLDRFLRSAGSGLPIVKDIHLQSQRWIGRAVSVYSNLHDIYAALENKNFSIAFDRVLNILDTLTSDDKLKKTRLALAFIRDKYKRADDLRKGWAEALPKLTASIDSISSRLSTLYSLARRVKTDSRLIDSLKTESAAFVDYLKSQQLFDYFYKAFGESAQLQKFITGTADHIERFAENFYRQNNRTITRTISFINDVMKSGDSKTLSRVIASYASPPLSYKQKRETRFSIDLNAFVGLYLGQEFNPESRLPGSAAWIYGLSAPIGFCFSWGQSKPISTGELGGHYFISRKGEYRKMKRNNRSITLSVVDIGAAVAYRLSNGPENELPQKITWAQVFSPGLHFQQGIRNTPLCLGLATQYTPQLRNFNNVTNPKQRDLKAALSLRVGIYFDLPLMNIYRK